MRITTVVVALLVFTACGGTEGPQGPAGPAGPSGSPGSGATGRLATKDATGALVAYDLGPYQDGAGVLWWLDPETARPDPTPAQLYYAAASCAGTAYVAAQVIGPPVRIDDHWVRRPNTLVSQVLQAISIRSSAGGGCAPASMSLRAIPLPSLVAVTEPAWAFAPPLRIEREQ